LLFLSIPGGYDQNEDDDPEHDLIVAAHGAAAFPVLVSIWFHDLYPSGFPDQMSGMHDYMS